MDITTKRYLFFFLVFYLIYLIEGCSKGLTQLRYPNSLELMYCIPNILVGIYFALIFLLRWKNPALLLFSRFWFFTFTFFSTYALSPPPRGGQGRFCIKHNCPFFTFFIWIFSQKLHFDAAAAWRGNYKSCIRVKKSRCNFWEKIQKREKSNSAKIRFKKLRVRASQCNLSEINANCRKIPVLLRIISWRWFPTVSIG
jgi:hypothetical protein